MRNNMVRINLNDLRNYLDNYDIENITYNSKPVYTLTVDNEEIFNNADIFTYELLADDTYSISLADRSYSGSIVIPSIYNGKSISTIAAYGFAESNITNVSFAPDSNITVIKAGAFEQCIKLITFNIPDSVNLVEQSIFMNCSKLATVVLSKNMTTIPVQMFSCCVDLHKINIPNSVSLIDKGAFEYCNSLTSITIPSNVSDIEEMAFQYCQNLTTVIPENSNISPSHIGRAAFYNTGITDTNFARYTEVIDRSAFALCQQLFLPKLERITEISPSLFDGTQIIDFKIPSSVSKIGSRAFYGARFTSITIPDAVTYIGANAFGNCVSLTTATFEYKFWNISNSGYNFSVATEAATALRSTYTNNSWTKYYLNPPRVTVNKPSSTSSLLEITIYNDNSLDLEVDGWLTYYLDDSVPTYNLPRVGEEIVPKNSSRTYKHNALDRESNEITSFNSAKLTGIQFINSGLAALPDIEINKKGHILTNGFVYPLHDQVYLNDNTSTSETELYCVAYNENSKEFLLLKQLLRKKQVKIHIKESIQMSV